MRIVLANLIIGLLGICSLLRGDDLFPSMRVYDIEGGGSFLPRGKTDLIFVGFELGARDDLSRWHEALKVHGALPQGVSYLAVPVLPECMAHDLIRESIALWLKKRISVRLQPCVCMLFADDAFQRLGLSSEEHKTATLYVFLVGKTGKILWRTKGSPTTEGMKTIKVLAQSDQLLGSPHR